MNIVDKLIEKTIETKNPTVVGLDPDISKIPACYKTNNNNANKKGNKKLWQREDMKQSI